jgi:predicted lipid-binding transport protein (Tim44 family)
MHLNTTLTVVASATLTNTSVSLRPTLSATNATTQVSFVAMSATSQPSADDGALIGGLVGGLVALLAIGGLAAVVVMRGRRRAKANRHNGDVRPPSAKSEIPSSPPSSTSTGSVDHYGHLPANERRPARNHYGALSQSEIGNR